MNKHFLHVFPLAMLVACGGGSNPEHDKMMAEHKAMLAADSTNKATTEHMERAMQRFFEIWQSGKPDGIEEVVAENYVEHNPIPGVTSTGIQALKDMITMSGAAFTQNKIEDLTMTTEGDRVVAHYKWKAVNSGPMGEGMPASNKPIDVYSVDIVRFENGKGVEHWGYVEEMKMMEQLGMMPAPGEAKK